MNPRLFALLLVLPVAVFATERLTSKAEDGGGKEKRRSEATSESTSSTSATSAEAHQSDPAATATEQLQKKEVLINPTTATQASNNSGFSDGEILGFKEMYEGIQGPESEYRKERSDVLRLYSEAIGEERKEWLEKHVKDPLAKTNPMGINLERSFSRCPSGYHIVIASKDDQPTNEGWLVLDDGCWDHPIARFRYDMQANTVDAFAGDSNGYLPLSKFLKLAKAAHVG